MFLGRTDVEAETPIFGHLMQRADSFEKTLMLGKIDLAYSCHPLGVSEGNLSSESLV